MTKRIKFCEKIKNNSKDVYFTDLRNLLNEKGFALKRVTGSHYIYSNGEITFVIPSHNNKVKEIYVKRVIEIIEKNEKGSK